MLTRWAPDEIARVSGYPTMTSTQIRLAFPGRSFGAVRKMAHRLGIVREQKSPECPKCGTQRIRRQGGWRCKSCHAQTMREYRSGLRQVKTPHPKSRHRGSGNAALRRFLDEWPMREPAYVAYAIHHVGDGKMLLQ